MKRILRVIFLGVLLALASQLPGPAAAQGASWQCWGPALLDPCWNTIRDLAVVPGSGGAEMWAVGEAGTILHWDQGAWQRVASPVQTHLYSVLFVSPEDGWAVGQSGTFLAWNGREWLDKSRDTSDYYFALAIEPGSGNYVSPGNYAGIGAFQQWKNGEFTKIKREDMFNGTLRSVWFTGPQDGWAAGDYPIVGGVMYRWDGTAWARYDIPDSSSLRQLAFTSPQSGWAVGDEGAMLRWDGSAWVNFPTGLEKDLAAVAMLSDSEGWAAGDEGLLLRWDGVQWVETPAVTGLDLFTLEMISPSQGWAAGEAGVILFWDGLAWRVVNAPAVGMIRGASISPGSGGQDGWAVTNGSLIYHWNGQDWQAQPGPTRTLHTVAMLSPTDGWVSGYQYDQSTRTPKFYRWDGVSWLPVDMPGPDAVNALAFASPEDGWAVGWKGAIYRWDGSAWTAWERLGEDSLYGLALLASNDIWAAGAGGALLHWDGQQWRKAPSPYTAYQEAIGFAGPGLGWAFGTYESAAWDGSAWVVQPGLPAGVRAVDMVDVANGWAAGYSGRLYRWDGSSWQEAQSPTSNPLYALDMVSVNDGWAVGYHGVILRYSAETLSLGAAVGIPENTPTPTTPPSTSTPMPSTPTPAAAVVVPATDAFQSTQAQPAGSPTPMLLNQATPSTPVPQGENRPGGSLCSAPVWVFVGLVGVGVGRRARRFRAGSVQERGE